MSAEDAKIKLHWLNGSRAQTIQWLLEELDVPYDLEIYHREKSMLAPAALEEVFPLGKSPLVTITPTAEGAEPFVLAESAFIMRWLHDHYGQSTKLAPPRWKEGQEGRIGGETEAWMRYGYLMDYVEGSLFPVLVVHLVISALKGPQIPFFIRPLSGMIASQVTAKLTTPNMKKHFGLLEGFLSNVPGGKGTYMCGEHLTMADILLGFPLLAVKGGLEDVGPFDKGSAPESYPKLFAYIDRLEKEPGFVKSCEKIREIEGHFDLMPRPGGQ